MLLFVQNKYGDNPLKGKPLSSTVQVTDISLFTMITAVRTQAINHYLFDSRFTLEIQKVVIILVLIYVDD